MSWNLKEASDYYKKQGAPGNQSAVLEFLREMQMEFSGIPRHLVPEAAESLGVKESFLLALIRRQPRLRLADTHVLELCAGPNCGKCVKLAALAEKLCDGKPGVTLRFTGCMRQCAKGPNLKWDGQLHNRADGDLLREILKNA